MKHTPGPWRVVKRANQTGIHSLAVATDSQQGGYWEPQRVAVLTEQNVADARLIAAAPDLLAAIQLLVDQRDARFNTALAWDQARAAIAKATS